MGCVGDIERQDEALAVLAREEAALRLRLGQLLEVLGRGAVFELGFSSLGAYAAERCERSARWVEAARCLARRLESLPELRRAVALGTVSWSMGDVLARVATPAGEGRWLELAKSRTVRQMRELVVEAMAAQRGAGEHVAVRYDAAKRSPGDGSGGSLQSGAGEICTVACVVDREEAWLFEATRCLLEQLGVSGAVEQSDALLAEAHGALLAMQPKGIGEGVAPLDGDGAQPRWVDQRRWVDQLRRWREEAEALCEQRVLSRRLCPRAGGSEVAARLLTVAEAASCGLEPLEHASCTALDREVRALGAAMAAHELELARRLHRFHRADGWRRLGYATETQYARERLGMSRSSVQARRALALRLEALPQVAQALGAAQLGVEAAMQLVRIATPLTEAAWVERARRRTIKHLREEVAAALTAVRLAGERHCPPPEDSEMLAFQALERAVVSGRFGLPSPAPAVGDASASPGSASGQHRLVEPGSASRKAWCVMLGSLASWLEGALQTSAGLPGAAGARSCSLAGRVTLRLRMSREAYAWWRALEGQARRWLPRGISWLRFACLSVWHAWRHLLGTDVAYGEIYIRDRFRCASPVCNRRDVTPHHIRFRSAGGSDSADNVTSICTWCHLHGVHGGRIRASGRADRMRWELGPRNTPSVVVDGRERLAA